MDELLGKLNTINTVVQELTERIEHVEELNRKLVKSRRESSNNKGLIIFVTIFVSGIPFMLLFISLCGLFQGPEFLVLAIISGCFLFLCIAGGRWLYKKTDGGANKEIRSINDIIETETTNINKLVNKNINILNILPKDYWYPLATDYILKVIKDRRANNINEALNMYDQQLHRWNMENMNATILAQSQAQTAYLKQINIYNQISAVTDVARMLRK